MTNRYPCARCTTTINVAARSRNVKADGAGLSPWRKNQVHSLTSTNRTAMAAAAAIAGETKWVRPLYPWRPSKLRFEVEAQRSPGLSLSGFIARHIEQPGSRHSKPALTKILSRPSDSACSLTSPEPGTIIALTLALETFLPSTILATARKSSIRALVHEPMKTRLIA